MNEVKNWLDDLKIRSELLMELFVGKERGKIKDFFVRKKIISDYVQLRNLVCLTFIENNGITVITNSLGSDILVRLLQLGYNGVCYTWVNICTKLTNRN